MTPPASAYPFAAAAKQIGTTRMRRLAPSLVALGLAVVVGRADDLPAPNKSSVYDDVLAPKGSPIYDALKQEFLAAQAKHARQVKAAQKIVGEAKADAEKQESQQKLENIMQDRPGPKFAVRFLEFAEKHPQDPLAFAAAMTAFKFSARPATKDNTLGQTLAWLDDHYADRPQIKQLVRILESSKAPAGETLLRSVLAHNPDHRIQGHACKALLAVSTKAGEKESLTKLLKGKYVDLFPDLSDGKRAPEIATKNVRGKDVKLSDLRGKVVVLDIWATWCPHCRAIIPHQREMVLRLERRAVRVGQHQHGRGQADTDRLSCQGRVALAAMVGGRQQQPGARLEYRVLPHRLRH